MVRLDILERARYILSTVMYDTETEEHFKKKYLHLLCCAEL